MYFPDFSGVTGNCQKLMTKLYIIVYFSNAIYGISKFNFNNGRIITLVNKLQYRFSLVSLCELKKEKNIFFSTNVTIKFAFKKSETVDSRRERRLLRRSSLPAPESAVHTKRFSFCECSGTRRR